MNFIGNIIWVLFGGFFLSLGYILGGLVLCLTIVGIPFGIQVMKLGLFALFPFGGDIVPGKKPMGCLSLLLNVLWIIFGGIEVALGHLTMGVIFCCTIIGIPFGLQHFKLMVLALMPFGHEVVRR
ncbi:MAG: YccF domain-containing protein [Alistipes sp.]|nr:YccF domain-containing protein [Alistipes sp.]